MNNTQTRYLFLLRIILSITDLLLLNLSFLLSFFILKVFGFDLHPLSYKKYLILINLIWLVSSSLYRMYHVEMVKTVEAILRVTWRSLILNIFIFSIYLTFTNDVYLSREFLFVFYCILAVLLFLSRFSGSLLEMMITRQYGIGKPVAILGRNPTGDKLGSFFESSRDFKFVGFLDDKKPTSSLFKDNEGTIKTSTIQYLEEAAIAGVKDVYVSLTPDRMPDAKYLLIEAEKLCIRLKFVPDFLGTMETPFNISYLEGFPIISLREEPLEDMQARFKKRILDLVFSLLVTVFLLSWLVPIIALLIKLESRGPVFFMQNRAGRGNEIFKIIKFRSMRVLKTDAETKQASKDDQRITKVGKFLRKTSLDEIPQFFNVLFGSMSIIGPRPHMLAHNDTYREIIDKYMVRQFLKPGISGWAQVNGYRGETKEHFLMEKRVEMDIWYMENWTLMLDVKIIFMTAYNIIKGEENAY
jgi:putative colanic acid biosynthesis UDP-glucose lipid carrier transferase